jgi:dCMP deaminase
MSEEENVEIGINTLKKDYEILENAKRVVGMKSSYNRLSWDEYFLSMVSLIGARGTCNRGRSGCVIVSEDNRILMSGYVGSPPGFHHCDEVGHEFEWRLDFDPNQSSPYDILQGFHKHCIRTIHAEMNAILYAARKGVALENATLYCTMTPCRRCAEAITQAGIKRVVTAKKYKKAEDSEEYFKRAGITLVTYGDIVEYP